MGIGTGIRILTLIIQIIGIYRRTFESSPKNFSAVLSRYDRGVQEHGNESRKLRTLHPDRVCKAEFSSKMPGDNVAVPNGALTELTERAERQPPEEIAEILDIEELSVETETRRSVGEE